MGLMGYIPFISCVDHSKVLEPAADVFLC